MLYSMGASTIMTELIRSKQSNSDGDMVQHYTWRSLGNKSTIRIKTTNPYESLLTTWQTLTKEEMFI
jgi:hypothetical protein